MTVAAIFLFFVGIRVGRDTLRVDGFSHVFFLEEIEQRQYFDGRAAVVINQADLPAGIGDIEDTELATEIRPPGLRAVDDGELEAGIAVVVVIDNAGGQPVVFAFAAEKRDIETVVFRTGTDQ